MHRCDGFTLIELIVTVSIIGILAAVPIPAFMENSESAETAEATITIDQVSRRAYEFQAKHNRFGTVREMYEEGLIDALIARALGVYPEMAADQDAQTGRDHGYDFTLQLSPDLQQFQLFALPAAPARGGRGMKTDDKAQGNITTICPEGRTLDPVTNRCLPEDRFQSFKAVDAIRSLNTLAGGCALARAQVLVKSKDIVPTVLLALDRNGDGRLSIDEAFTEDLSSVGRKLHGDFGKVTKPGPPVSKDPVEEIARSYARDARADLAPHIANAADVSIPIAGLKGDPAAFLGMIPSSGNCP